MILVEGMDNSGKTTLIQTLIRESKGRGYLRALVSLGPSKPEHEQRDWARTQLFSSGNPIIYDRFLPICDIVYGGVLRGGSIWTINSPYLKELKQLKNPLIIYCRPPKETILSFADGRAQMKGVVEKGEALVDEYDGVMSYLSALGFEIIKFDYTKDSIDKIKEIVEKRIKRDYPLLIK